MLKPSSAVTLLLLLGGCHTSSANLPQPSPVVAETTSPEPLFQSPTVTAHPVAEAVDHYQAALDKATAAQSIAQSALSKDDWALVASQWQASIESLQQIPASSSNHKLARQLLTQYQSNLARARQKSALPPLKLAKAGASDGAKPIPSPSSEGDRSFVVPIVQKLGGVPVVRVKINGENALMLLDTGASRTLITRGTRQRLALAASGSTSAKTANGTASFEVVKLESIELGQIRVQDLAVAVGNDDLNYGLLGHDFYQGYDITLREDSVLFAPR
jgi:clan AA aspartic protease (TIGR02281 family)